MPVILAVLAILGGVAYWVFRARNAANAAHEIVDMGREVIGAARQWNFKRKTNVHPVDGIDDPKLAAGGLAVALLDLGGLPSREAQDAVKETLQRELILTKGETEELLVLGQWFIQSCNGSEAAAPRLARRLKTLDGGQMLDSALTALKAGVAAGSGDLTDRQRDAFAEVARILRRA